MKKSVKIGIFVFLLVGVSFFAIGSLSSSRSHPARDILISINGASISLEDSLRTGKFSGDYVLNNVFSSESNIFGHQNDEIYLNVNGSFKTLKASIEDGSLKCTPGGKSPVNYNQIINGEFANDIWIDSLGMDLQTAINQGKFYAGDSVCIKPVITEYYVCSECLNVRHSDVSFYLKVKYSLSSKGSVPREELAYCYFPGRTPTKASKCKGTASYPGYFFKWTPPAPKENFYYLGDSGPLGFKTTSGATTKAIAKCEAVRILDSDC